MIKIRHCLECGKEIRVISRGDNNRHCCSQKCSKKHYAKNTKLWIESHPDAMTKYNKTRTIKNPGVWREKHHQERSKIIELLGGVCVVCGVSNPNWLHVDYIETTRNKPYRHPRHLRYIQDHLIEFRLLCANHHYELTLTGKIEGTDITQ